MLYMKKLVLSGIEFALLIIDEFRNRKNINGGFCSCIVLIILGLSFFY